MNKSRCMEPFEEDSLSNDNSDEEGLDPRIKVCIIVI